MPVMHPKRSPTSTGERELREGRMPSRKASCSVMGSHSLPPSSPMVSSANNPNKSEIPDRRKDMIATTVSEQRVRQSGSHNEQQALGFRISDSLGHGLDVSTHIPANSFEKVNVSVLTHTAVFILALFI